MDVRGWGDVAYHYIIGLSGAVYAARSTAFRGDTRTDYDPDGHFLVVLEGNFEEIHPSASQLERLPAVLAWAAEEYGIGTHTISGHRDHASTLCPGRNLYGIVRDGTLRSQVEAIIAGGGVTLL